MQTIGAFEAKTHFSALLEQVEKGEEILITKHGQPAARLLPVGLSKENAKEHAREAIQRIKDFQSMHPIELAVDWKVLRDEGRR
jgi:prevent-host-death family protein